MEAKELSRDKDDESVWRLKLRISDFVASSESDMEARKALSHFVSISNQLGHVLIDEYVRPKETITDYRTAFSGITPHHMRPGGPAKTFEEVQAHVTEICNDRTLVGHAIHIDLKAGRTLLNSFNKSVLMMSHPKKDIRDRSQYRPFKNLFKGRNLSLKALTDCLLGVAVQAGNVSEQTAFRKPEIPTTTVRTPKKALIINGRKVSQHRQRFIEKRRRIRRQLAHNSSRSKRKEGLFS
ncbi:hypothetical protein Aperf_G00000047193 [Anoplocephala perfoliata]